MIGEGKYDDLCTHVREDADAQVAIVIVIGGKRGSGLSVQSVGGYIDHSLPKLLRKVADTIEAELQAGYQ
jgi:hypothetical protein